MKIKFLIPLLLMASLSIISCSTKESDLKDEINQKIADQSNTILFSKELVKVYVPKSQQGTISNVDLKIYRWSIAKEEGITLEVDKEMEIRLIEIYKKTGNWAGRTSNYPWESPSGDCYGTVGCTPPPNFCSYYAQQGQCCRCSTVIPTYECRLILVSCS